MARSPASAAAWKPRRPCCGWSSGTHRCSCKGWGLPAGLRPAPALVPAAGRQQQQQQRAIRGLAGSRGCW
ncbi:hypothetical protein C1924_06280 [Stenotrophomonas sp. ESTM1D_MKCIP4_1]|nr:hypothetical protein C1924_06280 [Stenotrophomonas sp. ESTM1D_MKCIP4_1]